MAESFATVTADPAAGGSLSDRCQRVLGVTGVAISLLTNSRMTPLSASEGPATRLEEAQFMLGEGPSHDAFVTGRAVVETMLTSSSNRWPALASFSRDEGIEGILALPLQLGAVRVGVVTMYREESGIWPIDLYADALIAADVLTHVVLAMQANASPDAIAKELGDAGSYRAEVHQASGMLSAQGGIAVGEALVRLRGRAYVTGTSIAQLADDVIAHRLELRRTATEDPEWIVD